MFHISLGRGVFHSRGSEALSAMVSRLICNEVNNRSGDGLPTEHNTRERMQRSTASTLTALATAEERSLPSA